MLLKYRWAMAACAALAISAISFALWHGDEGCRPVFLVNSSLASGKEEASILLKHLERHGMVPCIAIGMTGHDTYYFRAEEVLTVKSLVSNAIVELKLKEIHLPSP